LRRSPHRGCCRATWEQAHGYPSLSVSHPGLSRAQFRRSGLAIQAVDNIPHLNGPRESEWMGDEGK